ncbi:MAG TPA: SGNH/GDSL hydrolase family protein [Candidatus Saccharimonadales bacterium]|nr:SGNH/GDSL hydrolase family protein [Candidatus Saccharimonadales bacterium]
MKNLVTILLLTFAITLTGFFVFRTKIKAANLEKNVLASQIRPTVNLTPTPTPEPELPFRKYEAPQIEKKREYTIVMIGDSMTHALGPHGGKFYEDINKLYKDSGHGILVDNYAIPSTNILQLDHVINTKTKVDDATFDPLFSRKFDLILIESFAYNPLSQFGITGGIKRQNHELDKLMEILRTSHSDSGIMFVATIAPNKESFSKKVHPDIKESESTELADERIAYLKNHIKYAEDHGIPLANIYEKSLTKSGDGNLDYINPDDDIHPSAVGLEFIGRELAKDIYDNNIFPK